MPRPVVHVELLDFLLHMDTLEFIVAILGGGFALTLGFRLVINLSKKISSKQIAKAGDDAKIDQKQIHVEGDYYEAPKNQPDSKQSANSGDGSPITQTTVDTGGGDYIAAAQPAPEPKEPPLSDHERELLFLIEPGGHFTYIKTLSKTCVVYDKRGETHLEFHKLDEPMFNTRYIEALDSLTQRGLLKKSKDKYTLTGIGDTLRKSLLPPSD